MRINERVERLERNAQISDGTLADVRHATDAQLEAYLLSHGIDPHDDGALCRVAVHRVVLPRMRDWRPR